MLTHGISPAFRGGIHLFIYSHTPSGQSRDYVACRGPAGTGPVVLKAVPVTGMPLQVTMAVNIHIIAIQVHQNRGKNLR